MTDPNPTPSTVVDEAKLRRRIESLKPWRMNVQLTDRVSTGEYTETAAGQTNSAARRRFLTLVDSLFPNQLDGKKFLDCGCNAGAYCFWARQRNTNFCYGFDIRQHWIQQARFLRHHRTVAETDRIQFEVADLYELPAKDLEPFDLVNFRDLFHHLPEPVAGLRIAADYSKDILLFSTPFLIGRPDDSLVVHTGKNDSLHGRTEAIAWFPTGPKICGDILKSLGFEEIKLLQQKATQSNPNRGRLTIVAARDPGRLACIDGEAL